MIGYLLPTVSLVLFVVSFFSVLAMYSLQDFSRSRLDDICRGQGREQRFGLILRRHEDALLASGYLCLLSVALLAVVLVLWLGLLEPVANTTADWWTRILEVLLVAGILVPTMVVVPWAVARVAGERFLCRCWPLLNVLLMLLRPLIVAARRLDTLVHRLSGLPDPHREGPHKEDIVAISEEIRTVVDEGEREGLLEQEARTMIHRVMELQEEDTAAIMTPRTDMFCIGADSTIEEARERFLEAGHSRVPVIGETTDDIVGILYAKDLLRYLNSNPEQVIALRDIVREPFYVPETTGIDTLLEMMKRRHVHIAIVIDEYSGVAGLVTMEDILEEIVGEIVDEYDTAEDDGIRPVEPGVIEVESRVHIDDLNERFGFDLPENDDFDTIGGFVYTQFGRIPEQGESFTWRNLLFRVLSADKRRLHHLRIEAETAPSTGERHSA